jgi:hypothetical protein
MSKRINVNPDHYKSAGRERPTVVAAARQSRAKGASSPSAPQRDPRQKGKALLADRRPKKKK